MESSTLTGPGEKRALGNAYYFIQRYWMPLGLLVFLTVPFWAPARNAMKTNIYIFSLLPTLLLLTSASAMKSALQASSAFRWLALFLFTLMISTLWAPSGEEQASLQQLFYTFIFIYGIGFHLRIDEPMLVKLLGVGIFAATCGSAITFMLLLNGHAEVTLDERLVGYGALFNPLLSGNLYGVFLVALIALAVTPIRMRGVYLIGAVIGGLLILAFVIGSGSRSPLVGLIAATTLLLCRKGGLKALKIWIAFMLIISLIVAALWQVLAERGLSLRPDIWRIVIELCLEHPWLGRGVNAPITISTAGFTWSNTHNLLLTIWYFGGIPALFSWVALNASLVYQLWRRRTVVSTIALGLLIYGIGTTFFEGSGLPSRPTEFWYQIWLPVGLGIWALTHTPDMKKGRAHSEANSV